jgi:hypothetical protein
MRSVYVLLLNGVVHESDVLYRVSLPRMRMPNRDGFIDDQRPGVHQIIGPGKCGARPEPRKNGVKVGTVREECWTNRAV